MLLIKSPCFIIKRSWFALAALTTILSLSSIAQDAVTTLGGVTYKGKVVSIGNVVRLEQANKVLAIDRDSIESIDIKKSSNSYVSQPPLKFEDWYIPLDRKVIFEMAGAIYTLSPYAVSVQGTTWLRMNKLWSVGVGGGIDFWQFVNMNANLKSRIYLRRKPVIRPFIETAASVSFVNRPLMNSWQVSDYKYSPAMRGSLGFGLQLDTGVGLGLMGQFGVSGSYVSIKEYYGDYREVQTEYAVFAPFLLAGFIF